MMMKLGKEIAISSVFILILILPSLESVFNFMPKVENNENRALKSKPKANINLLDLFPEEYDSYYSDNFDLRNQLLWLNSKLKFNIYNNPPVEGKAFIGRDGWMYITKHQMETYRGDNILTDKQLTRYHEIFEYRRNFLDSIGCKYYVVIVPTKTSVYSEYLPLSKRKEVEFTRTDQLSNLLDTMSGIKFIDLRRTFIDNKGKTRMYHKTDNHWNEYGAFIGYKKIINDISKDFPSIVPYSIDDFVVDSTEKVNRTLPAMMGIYDDIVEYNITCRPNFSKKASVGSENNYPIPKYFGYKDEYEIVYEIDNDSLPKVLVIRDSFGTNLMPFLNEHFSKSVFIFDAWNHEFNEEIVINEKPDIYIQLVLEMFAHKISSSAKKP